MVYSLLETPAWGEERYQRMRREAEDEEPLDPGIFDRSTGDQEELIDILRSIMFDGRRISSVNVPNTGYMPNLPQGAVLEIPGVATARTAPGERPRLSRHAGRDSGTAAGVCDTDHRGGFAR